MLSRGERILKLKEQERWTEGRSPLGLPKVRVTKTAVKKKKKAKEEGDAAGGEHGGLVCDLGGVVRGGESAGALSLDGWVERL